MNELLAERLADYAWAIAANDRSTLGVFRKVIEAGGGSWEDDGYQVTLTGPSGIRGGFTPGHEDPVTACVMVNFMLFGQLWAQVPPAAKALEVINKRWADHVKSQKERRKAQQNAGKESADSLQLTIDL
jgi:hypothetical protein